MRPDLRCQAGLFLLPARASTERVCLVGYLNRGMAIFLPSAALVRGCTTPTVNLLRKWYHTHLNFIKDDTARRGGIEADDRGRD